MPRYVTFRFDDGHIAGARKAAELLRPDHGSFFIITGPVEGNLDLQYPELVKGDRGNLEAWRAVAALGHDIQPHSVTHPRFLDLSSDEQKAEIRNSIEFVRKIHSGPYVFCYPFNVIPTPQPIVEELSAAGFYSNGFNFNLLAEGLDRFALRSWAIKECDFDLIVRQLAESVPDNAWIIFGLHSLDGEGWAPWTSASLSCLIAAVRDLDYQIVTVAEMIGKIAAISSRDAVANHR